MHCEKRTYPSKHQALMANSRNGKRLRAYRCELPDHPGLWHVTAQGIHNKSKRKPKTQKTRYAD